MKCKARVNKLPGEEVTGTEEVFGGITSGGKTYIYVPRARYKMQFDDGYNIVLISVGDTNKK